MAASLSIIDPSARQQSHTAFKEEKKNLSSTRPTTKEWEKNGSLSFKFGPNFRSTVDGTIFQPKEKEKEREKERKKERKRERERERES